MVDWQRFTPSDFEYDFERDELAQHGVTFDEAVECVALLKKRRDLTPSKSKPTQDQVDRVVTAQADKASAWQKAIVVKRPKSTSLSIPAELAARAAFLARLHRESRVDKWVERIVTERVEIEESAFTAAKKTLAS